MSEGKKQGAVDAAKGNDLISIMGREQSMDRNTFWNVLRTTIMPKATNDEQAMVFLAVAKEYGLSPLTKEIFAFEDKGRVIPVVSVDGWASLINRQESLDGVTFIKPDESEMVTPEGGKPCFPWMTCCIWIKGRSKPVEITEYLDEVYREAVFSKKYNKTFPGPWQTHTKRMLRHKTLIQGARVAFSFSGIYDEDEAERIKETDFTIIDPSATAQQATDATAADLKAQLTSAKGEVKEGPDVDQEQPEPGDGEDTVDALFESLEGEEKC